MIKTKTIQLTFLICLSVFITSPSSAETVKLFSGETLQGKVTGLSRTAIDLETSDGKTVSYTLDEIETIDGQSIYNFSTSPAQAARAPKKSLFNFNFKSNMKYDIDRSLRKMKKSENIGIVPLFIFLLVFFFAYVISVHPLYLIAQKLNVENAWVAYVPIFSLYTLVKCAGKSGLWIFLFFIPIVNIITLFVVWKDIAVGMGKSPWWCMLILAPGGFLALEWYLALCRVPEINDTPSGQPNIPGHAPKMPPQLPVPPAPGGPRPPQPNPYPPRP